MYAVSVVAAVVFTLSVAVCVPLSAVPEVISKFAPASTLLSDALNQETNAVADIPVITHDIVVSVPLPTSEGFASTSEFY